MRNIFRNVIEFFMCKIGHPLFSPSRTYIGDPSCNWCKKVHGGLSVESNFSFMNESIEALFAGEEE